MAPQIRFTRDWPKWQCTATPRFLPKSSAAHGASNYRPTVFLHRDSSVHSHHVAAPQVMPRERRSALISGSPPIDRSTSSVCAPNCGPTHFVCRCVLLRFGTIPGRSIGARPATKVPGNLYVRVMDATQDVLSFNWSSRHPEITELPCNSKHGRCMRGVSVKRRTCVIQARLALAFPSHNMNR